MTASTNPVSSYIASSIAVISTDHPPVNALSHAVRSGLHDALLSAIDHPAVRAIVIICAGKTFFSGADIKEFGQPPRQPRLRNVFEIIDRSAKPIVAAIHGTCLGGGFELALACHFRVAVKDAKVGLPEVKLGILPGAGGTQRLPRLIGADAALSLILDGNPIDAPQALSLGTIDAIVADDLLQGSLEYARQLVSEGTPLRRASDLTAKLTNKSLFESTAKAVAISKRGFLAPPAIIKCVQAATELDFERGMARELELFDQLVVSREARAQRHIFFAEREVSRIPGLPKDTPVRSINKVAILGAGTMGAGIAVCFANAGFQVTLLDAQQDNLARGIAYIGDTWQKEVDKRKIDEATMQTRMALIHPTLSWNDLADADLVIEAVFEDMAVKQDVFSKLDAACKDGAILATNTSYLDIDRIAEATRRPQDVIGMHFFSPANIMPLLECVRASKTAQDVCATIMKLGRKIGKTPVVVGNCYGFVGNRMLAKRSREAWFLLEEGALPQQVDQALYDFGFPMGPFAVLDLAGLDVAWRNRLSRIEQFTEREKRCNLLDQICELKRFGQKSQAGMYLYECGSRTGKPDPRIEELIISHSRRHNIERREIPTQEILERCLFAMINEGARILEEGIVSRPEDIDIIWIKGYGFPAYRGGPMFYADEIGLNRIYDRICSFQHQFGADFWTPAPLLERLARAGEGFYSRKN